MMSQWQPIETAPKDGQVVLGYGPDRDDIHLIWFGSDSQMREDWFLAKAPYNKTYQGIEHPTHWMPLPESPS